MGNFKQWLLLEDIAKDSEAHGDVMYPSIAGDYMYAVSDPVEFLWLQWRWRMDKKLGREFHNIDQEEFEKRKYVSLQSTTLPDEDWKNKKDTKPFQVPKVHKTLKFKKIGKNSKENKFLKNKGYVSIDGNLESIFRDKDYNQWPKEAEDRDWKKYKN